MSLLSCEEVRPWARSIKDVVVSIDGGKLVEFGRPW